MTHPRRRVRRVNEDAETEIGGYRREAIESARGLLREIVDDDTIEFAVIALRDVTETDYEARVVVTCSSQTMTAWFDALSDVAQTIGENDPQRAATYFVARLLQMTKRLEEGLEGEQEEGQVPGWFQL